MKKYLKSITFDLDTKSLQEHYPNNKDWHNAYSDIKNFLKSNNFIHVQGSVYDSTVKMSDVELQRLIYQLCNKFEWFSKSVKDIRGNNQPTINNYTYIAKAYNKNKNSIITDIIQESTSKEHKLHRRRK